MAEADCIDTQMVLKILREQYLYVPYPISVDGIALGLPRQEGWIRSMSGRGSSAQEIFRESYNWSDSPLLVLGPSPERQPATLLWCPKRSLHLHSQYIDGALKSLIPKYPRAAAQHDHLWRDRC